jgi:GTP-binding protein YchF
MLRIGIIGLPGSGKTSLFRALTGSYAEVGAGGKRAVHIGQAKVADPRLDELHRIFAPPRKVNAVVEYVDVAGITAGDARKAGFEGHFLGDVRSCDALLHVLRDFQVLGLPPADPLRDFRFAQAEFLLSDQMILEKREQRIAKELQKNPRAELKQEADVLRRCLAALEEEIPLRELEITPAEDEILRPYQLLTRKPQLVVLNLAEERISAMGEAAAGYAREWAKPGIEFASACASLEMEIAQLDDRSAAQFMQDLGIQSSALDRLIRASYHLLGLISFFTIGKDECRAWTIRRGTSAQEAAGVVHSDMERGFIRAEVVSFEDFIRRGNYAVCRTDGVLRMEGKNYIVKDGDIIEFRFAV